MIVDSLPDLKVYTKDHPSLMGIEFKTFMIDMPHKTLTKTSDVQYSVTWTIPRNNTPDPIVYTFELYVNDEPSGMLATVTVLAREQKTVYDKVSNFWVSPDVFDCEGGVATFNISLKKVLVPHLRVIPLSLALQSEVILETAVTSNKDIFLSSHNLGTLGYHRESKTFVSMCPRPLECFFEAMDGTIYACEVITGEPGLYKFNGTSFEKLPQLEVSGNVMLMFENEDGDITVISAPDDSTIDVDQFIQGAHTFLGSIDTDAYPDLTTNPLWRDTHENNTMMPPRTTVSIDTLNGDPRKELIGDTFIETTEDPASFVLWDDDEIYTALDLYCPSVVISRDESVALLRSEPLTKLLLVTLR